MSKTAKGPKLVIHLGGRSRNITSPPRSEGVSFRKGQELTSSNVGNEDMAHLKVNKYIDQPDSEGRKIDNADQVKGSYQFSGEIFSEVSNISSKLSRGKFADAYESVSPLNTRSLLGKRSIEDVASDVSASRRNKYSKMKYGEDESSAKESKIGIYWLHFGIRLQDVPRSLAQTQKMRSMLLHNCSLQTSIDTGEDDSS